MGVSASSLLDETKANYIKGQAEAELKNFSPCYRKQFFVAYFSQVQDELEQHKEQITQLLKQREAPEEGEVLYEEGVLFFDDTRKWRERYVVVRANYCLECHDSLETFVKGIPPRQKLLPTGGAALTTEEKYTAMVDKCFPDDTISPNNLKEDFAPPLSGMPGQFPVYLRLPYRRDSYFCFKQEAKQAGFLSILSDCIRHQNQDFLKKDTCEVQAFLKAVQLYRQEKGRYEAWDMLMGSDVRVMANLVMEQLLPSLEKDMLPRLKAKKTERKRVWFATVEAAYILVQEQLLEGLSALKEECRTAVRQQEVLIHSDMDQINNSRALLEGKIKASVLEPAEKFCAENVQPYLASVLEELMEPISSGFQEARQLSDSMMDQICQDFQVGGATEDLKRALTKLSRPDLLSCYQRISSLQEKLHHLQQRFGFSNIISLIHSAQIDLQQLMENAAYTFEQLLHKAMQDNPDNAGSAMDKAKHRVLKQYDYDSSTVRKRIFQEALVAITLPHIKKNLAPTCKSALEGLEQFIYADHSNFVHVENVYEGILLQTLDKEVTKVVKEAANHKKHNLFTDSRDVLSQSSRSSLSSPSTPGSPARVFSSTTPPSPDPQAESQAQGPAQPPSPLVSNGLAVAPEETLSAVVEEVKETTEDVPLAQAETVAAAIVASVLAEKVEEMETTPSVAATQQAQEETKIVETTAENIPVPTETPKDDVPVPPETAAAAADTTTPAETEKVGTPAAPETVTGEEVVVVETVTVETSVEPETQSTDVPVEAASPETPSAVESVAVKTDAQEEAAATQSEATQSEAPVPSPDPTQSAAPEPVVQQTPEDAVAESMASLTVITTEEEPASVTTITTTEEEPASMTTVTSTDGDSATVTECKSSPEAELEAPSSGAESVTAPTDGGLEAKAENVELVTVSDPSSLHVSVGSDSAPSDPESVEGPKESQSSEDEVSATSDLSEDDIRASESPASSDEGPAELMEATTETLVTASDEPSPQAPAEDISGDPTAGEEVTADANASVESEPSVSVEAPETASDTQASASAEPAVEATPAEEASSPDPGPLDSIKEIRDLVVEVIEVEELVQRYPCGVPKADED